MAETPEKSSEFPVGELREFTLRIPGEHFFCDTISFPHFAQGRENMQDFAEFVFERGRAVSLSCLISLRGVIRRMRSRGKFLYSQLPLAKLRQLGWQNLELFRRVFPSFISLLAN